MMPVVAGYAFGRARGVTTIQTDIRAGGDKSANNRKVAAPGSYGKRCIKSIVITMNIRIGFGAQQGLNCSQMTAPHSIHERGLTLS
jgi:hypothetical protein